MTMDASIIGAAGDADTVLTADQKNHTAVALQTSNTKTDQPLPTEECSPLHSSTSNSPTLESSKEDSELAETSPISSCDSFPSVPETLNPKKTVNPVPPSPKTSRVSPPRTVRTVSEADVYWLCIKSECVLTPVQRYDAVSIVHMVSPQMFMVVSHFGNERPVIGRFLAIQEALAKHMRIKVHRPVHTLKLGSLVLLKYKGEYARAVFISDSRARPDYLRFACLDIHAVIEVPLSDICCLPNEFHPTVVPCNLFLAYIHGVGSIKKSIVQKYLDRFNCQESPVTTVCAIRSLHNSRLEIDFVLDDQWISETLLSQNDATPCVFLAEHRKKNGRSGEFKNMEFSALPSPTVVRGIVEAMIEAGSYDFPANASILDTANVSFIRPDLYPGYHLVLKKICPDSPLLLQKTIEEPKIEEEAHLQADDRVSSPEVCEEVESPRDPWNDNQQVQEKLNILKGELDRIRAGTVAETDAVLSDLIMTAVSVSFHPGSLWTQQLTALADELRTNAVSSKAI